MQAASAKLLKKDIFGEVRLLDTDARRVIVRDCRTARWWARPAARRLLAREARALARLESEAGFPRLLGVTRDILTRSWLPGSPMHEARPSCPGYFRRAAHLLRRLHRLGIVHNDLAKEANWLVTPGQLPAIVDFQLAWHTPRRGRLFRLLATEDLRHLLKHKRSYCPMELTARERRILAEPSVASRLWMRTGKPVYLVVTRRLLGWADREGAADR